MNKGFSIFFFIVVTGLFLESCTPVNHNNETENTYQVADTLQGTPKIVFNIDSHDFGTIVQGEVVTYTFLYRNEGEGGLVLTSASSSCGCTVPNYSKEPLLPGEQGKLEVVFDSKGKMGVQNKTVGIRTNGVPVRKILKIHVEVVPPNSN
jgi:hypothetical protein